MHELYSNGDKSCQTLKIETSKMIVMMEVHR